MDPLTRGQILPMDLIKNTSPVGLDNVICGGQLAESLEKILRLRYGAKSEND
ncbi:MAG: hypothetical protein HOI07_05610 [Betaproteobacteria bacterium]|nr:hypothetical protein [Betaproteobacteria bacterium]